MVLIRKKPFCFIRNLSCYLQVNIYIKTWLLWKLESADNPVSGKVFYWDYQNVMFTLFSKQIFPSFFLYVCHHIVGFISSVCHNKSLFDIREVNHLV